MIVRQHRGILSDREAEFSDCARYRYRLLITWDSKLPALAFCMLNPSTADEYENDPTVERCQRRALAWGYGRLIVVNLFALRSTDPKYLYADRDPTGGRYNDLAIVGAAQGADKIVLGWGNHGDLHGRGEFVKAMLAEKAPGKAHYLTMTNSGHPAHPLYLPYELLPQPMTRPKEPAMTDSTPTIAVPEIAEIAERNAARDAGIKLAADHADAVSDRWTDRAFVWFRDFAKQHREFTTEQVRITATANGFPPPPDKRSWGYVAQRAAKAGIVVKNGYAPSVTKDGHGHPISVWRSLL